MLKKIENNYSFSNKRDRNLITPCCNKPNKNGKFVNYKHLPSIYGFCHSCGKSSLPPTIYKDEKGIQFTWNNSLNKYEKIVLQIINTPKVTQEKKERKNKKYIPESKIWKDYLFEPNNNLTKYLLNTYNHITVFEAIYMYVIGSTSDGGTVFWNINKNLKVKKCKVSYYEINGRRTNKFKVPYKNEGGFYSCLFGEHLIIDSCKGNQIIVLVESEKTAIVGAINLPKYTWLAYGGLNGFTEDKYKSLIGHKVLLVPDISKNAISVMEKKIPLLRKMGIDANLWDMTNGKNDEQLREEGIYNYDLEDYIRKI